MSTYAVLIKIIKTKGDNLMKIKVATYNILHCENFLTEIIDYNAFAKVIKELDADIIGLNEVHGEGSHIDYDEQAEILGKKLDYNYYFGEATRLDGGNPFGNALLTRFPIKEVVTIPIPDPNPHKYDGYYETRCVIKLVTATKPELTFLITHFGLNEDEQENAVKTILANLPEENAILMGDLNVMPDNKQLDPIRERMTDAVTASDDVSFTFPADKPNRKIDYIFVSKNIKPLSFKAENIVLSDHLPVTAVLEIQENV